MKPLLIRLHKWAGLALGLQILLQAVTGILITNRDALMGLFYGAGPVVAELPLDQIMENLRDARPDHRVERIITPPDGLPLVARLEDRAGRMEIAHVDPVTGDIRSIGPLWRYPLQLADRLHVSLMMGAAGHAVLLTEALVLLFMLVSGLIVWWPPAGRYIRALIIHRGKGRMRFLRDLHVVPAALLALPLIVMVTAASLVIAEPLVGPAVEMMAPVNPPLAIDLKPVPPGTQPVGQAQALAMLRARFPDGQLRQIRHFGPQYRLLGVVMLDRDAVNPRAHHMAGLDRATGELIVYADANDSPAGQQIIDWILPLHSGEWMGSARGFVVTLEGLGLAALVVTGFWMWLARRRVRRRVKAAATATVLALLLVPVVPDADAGQPYYGGQVRVAINSDILSTNPGVLRDGNTDTVLYHVGEALVAYRDDLSVAPLLAESVTLSPDRRTYSFVLRPGLIFHNGAPVTAREVKWSWDRLMDPATGFRCREYYDGRGANGLKLELVEMVDDRTVRFHLNKPSALFLDRMANLQCQTPILHPDSVGPDGQWRAPIGTGPYRLGEWKRGQSVTLDRFDGYVSRTEPRDGLTGEKKAWLDRIIFTVVPDRLAAKSAVYAGNMDLVFAVPLAAYGELKRRQEKRGDIRLYRHDTLDWTVLLMQSRDPLLSDVRLRRAIAQAISAPLVAEISSFGLAQPNPSATQGLSPFHTAAHDQWLPYDPAAARALAREAGYEGQELVIQANRRFSYMFDNAVAAQAMLTAAGFNVRIEVMDWATQLSNFFNGRFQISSFGYSARSHPALMAGNFTGSKSLRASFQWEDPMAMAALERIEGATDTAALQAELDLIHRRMREDVPMIGLYNDHIIDVSTARMQGYQPWAFGRPRLWGVWMAPATGGSS